MSDATSYRIVLDTNVVVGAGSRWVMEDPPLPQPGHLPSQIVHCVASTHNGLWCDDILLEYAEKLEELKHPPARIMRYLGLLLLSFERVNILRFFCEPRPADLNDTIFILCALNGQAHFLISEDRHLLDLKDAYDPPKICSREDMRVPLGL